MSPLCIPITSRPTILRTVTSLKKRSPQLPAQVRTLQSNYTTLQIGRHRDHLNSKSIHAAKTDLLYRPHFKVPKDASSAWIQCFGNPSHRLQCNSQQQRYLNANTEGNKDEKGEEPVINITFMNEKDYNEESNNSDDYSGDSGDELDRRSKFTEEVPIKFPDVGENLKGKISRWFKKEGDWIKHGDALCDIETDLFTFSMDIDDECDGIMGKIFVQENNDEGVEPGTILCIVLHEPVEAEEENTE